jgi:hypothetical protein
MKTEALDYLLKGEAYLQFFRKDANAEGQRMYRAAIKADPTFARPYAYQAFAVLQAYLYTWSAGSADAAIKEMQIYADLAMAVDPNDYHGHWIRAAVSLYSQDFANAKAQYAAVAPTVARQGIPDDQWAFQVDRADMLLLTGNAKQAIADVTTALNAAPVPERWFYWVLGWAYYVDRQYPESLNAFARFRVPRNAIRKNVIANLIAVNDLGEAQKQAALFLDEEKAQGITYAAPGQSVIPGLLAIEDRIPFEDKNQLQLWKDRLQQAFDKVPQP